MKTTRIIISIICLIFVASFVGADDLIHCPDGTTYEMEKVERYIPEDFPEKLIDEYFCTFVIEYGNVPGFPDIFYAISAIDPLSNTAYYAFMDMNTFKIICIVTIKKDTERYELRWISKYAPHEFETYIKQLIGDNSESLAI